MRVHVAGPGLSARRREGPVAIEVGDVAPDVDLPDERGERWRLSDHRGRPVVLLFHRHLA